MKKYYHTLAGRIGLGYALVLVLLGGGILMMLFQVEKIKKVSHRIIQDRAPTTQASLKVISGVNQSVGALRGWLILKDESLKKEWEDAWQQLIKPAMYEMHGLSTEWTNPKNIQDLQKAEDLIRKLEHYQNEIEHFTILNDSAKANELLRKQAVPTSLETQDILTQMHQRQKKLMLADELRSTQVLKQMIYTNSFLLGAGVLLSVLLSIVISRSVSRPVNTAIKVANNIAEGHLNFPIRIQGPKELQGLGKSLLLMRDALKVSSQKSKDYNWLSNGYNQLSQKMLGEIPLDKLSNHIIGFLCQYLKAVVGALYLLNERGDELQLQGRYAFAKGEEFRSSYRPQEGLVGQAYTEKKPIWVEQPTAGQALVCGTFTVSSPIQLLVYPFLYKDQVLGVIELGTFTPFTPLQKEFIQEVMPGIGIRIQAAITQKQIIELLEETQAQAEELETQQEELRQTNEELEEQSKLLKTQQEEMLYTYEQLQLHRKELESKNGELESKSQDLIQHAEQLTSASKYKSEFLANMSHELRTPLNSMLILSETLAKNQEGNLEQEQVECAQIIHQSGMDLLNLINDILDLSKIEAGKMHIEKREVSLSKITESIHYTFTPLVHKKGLSLSVDIAPEVPDVIWTDLQKLNQILKNLLSNAVKFTEQGDVSVRFSIQSPGLLSIKVRDTGIGIPQEKKKTIFEAFQQAEGGISRKYGGTGLGLSIALQLTYLLDGQIELESQVNKGSEFTLTFPLIPQNTESTDTLLPEEDTIESLDLATQQLLQAAYINYPSIKDDRQSISKQDIVVLIVEDDAHFARILKKQANAKNYKCLVAATGEDGLLLIEKYRPDAIILDLELPGMHGNSLLKELKVHAEYSKIPVHIISATEYSLDSYKAGVVQCLTKPVNQSQLEEVFGEIETFIHRKMKYLLIVEDDAHTRKHIKSAISSYEIKLFEADTAETARKIIEKQTIDCIVLDLILPGPSGFDLINDLQRNQTHQLPPIIVYTGKELSEDEVNQMNTWAKSIIIKSEKSEERLLDETALFLHHTVDNLPHKQQQLIQEVYDKEEAFKNKKVLLVDDDMRNMFALSKVLKAQGIHVLKAENGLKALNVLEQEPDIHLVLMDIMMPEMDGYEAMRRIRKQPAFHQLPIIALTAKAMKEDRKKCIDAGANDYFTKPVEIDKLLSLIRVWIH
ncbi:response regulator [Rapidithrix thailandica]|uniref:histidine kinase n=1 Tax=Rapidithrix thailandica TaxID=413964 RepID=A0AAW9S044_9BACT